MHVTCQSWFSRKPKEIYRQTQNWPASRDDHCLSSREHMSAISVDKDPLLCPPFSPTCRVTSSSKTAEGAGPIESDHPGAPRTPCRWSAPTSESVMMLPEEGVWVGMRGGLAGGGLNRGRLSEHGCSSSGVRAGSPPPRPLGLFVEPRGPWRLCLHGHRSWLLVLLCTSYYLKLT